jgi:hypothetical protein
MANRRSVRHIAGSVAHVVLVGEQFARRSDGVDDPGGIGEYPDKAIPTPMPDDGPGADVTSG